jgi:hypothetical protein
MKSYIKNQKQKINEWLLKQVVMGDENLKITSNNYTIVVFLVILFVILIILSIL